MFIFVSQFSERGVTSILFNSMARSICEPMFCSLELVHCCVISLSALLFSQHECRDVFNGGIEGMQVEHLVVRENTGGCFHDEVIY